MSCDIPFSVNVASHFFADIAFASNEENRADIGDVVGDKLKGRFHLRLDVVDNLPPSYMSVVDAEGEMGVVEIAPVIGDNDVLDIPDKADGLPDSS